MSSQIWWHVTRASGIVAWLMLTASVLWGIFLSTRMLQHHRRPAWLLDLHRWLGALTIAFVTVHLAALVANSYVHFGLVELLAPYDSSWKPGPVALGIVGFYVLIAVEISSLLMRRLPRRAWRAIHLTSYLAFWLTSLHAATAGTDAAHPLYRWTAVLSIAALVFAATYRVLTRRPSRRAPGRARKRR